MTALIGQNELDEDEFWNQDKFKDEENDNEFEDLIGMIFFIKD